MSAKSNELLNFRFALSTAVHYQNINWKVTVLYLYVYLQYALPRFGVPGCKAQAALTDPTEVLTSWLPQFPPSKSTLRSPIRNHIHLSNLRRAPFRGQLNRKPQWPRTILGKCFRHFIRSKLYAQWDHSDIFDGFKNKPRSIDKNCDMGFKNAETHAKIRHTTSCEPKHKHTSGKMYNPKDNTFT